jgi:hypothetical protein
MRLRLDLDPQTAEALAVSAVREMRPAPMQAEVLLRRALGLPVPKESPANDREPVAVGLSDA